MIARKSTRTTRSTVRLSARLDGNGCNPRDEVGANDVELGSTFYASRVKHQVVEAFAGKATKPTWVGIDNSKLMQDTTDLLHDDAVKVLNHTSLHRGGPGHVLLSRFVASTCSRARPNTSTSSRLISTPR